jgi:hypothetical protein
MLQYGDSSAPFQKSFPSIGLKEIYYNSVKDCLVQNKVSIKIFLNRSALACLMFKNVHELRLTDTNLV